MQDWIMMLMEEYGYISLFLLMIIENVFPPIPSEVILTFAGFMVQHPHQSPSLLPVALSRPQ